MSGHFDDGTVALALGEHVFATPGEQRANVITVGAVREPPLHGMPAVVMDSGGGVMDLAVTGQCLRADLGDAERFIYEVLRALAVSGPGTLACTDVRGNRVAFEDAFCVGAVGEVHAFRFADVAFDFMAPATSADPSTGSGPSAPGTYPGTGTLLDYEAGGVTIGTHPEGMRIEMSRRFELRAIPRARGARSRGPAMGAVIRLTVTSHAVVDGSAPGGLAAYLRELARRIGPRPVDLTANGNTYEGVVLERLRPAHTDRRHTRFTAEFLMEVPA